MIDKETGFRTDTIAGRDIYVDLDSLFDTRLAILDKIDNKYSTLIYEAGFANRTEDAFPRLSKEQFKKLFDDRDNDILANSLLTNVMMMVKEHAIDCIKKLHNTPGKKELNIYVNVWPYTFDKEGIEIILKPIYNIVENRINVHAINLDPKTISTTFFGDKFAFIVMYDYMRWLTFILNDPKTAKNTMGKTTLIAPKLYLGETYSEKDMQEILDSGNFDPFKEVELVCAPFIGLEFYDIALFSAILSPDFIQLRKKELGLVTT